MIAIPFENLDIFPRLHRIKLEKQALWDKIIIKRRGGFCYELNGLFAWLLKEIGFKVTYLNGRVYDRNGKRGPDFDHLVLQVETPDRSERWLADVGFGDSFLEPLNFGDTHPQIKGLRAYQLLPVEGGMDMFKRDYDGEWKLQYFFDLQPRNFPDDYDAMCIYHQTSPRSSFTHSSVISIATSDGRVTLDDDHLIVTKKGRREDKAISLEERPNLLKEYFDVVL